jgi:TolB-like protein
VDTTRHFFSEIGRRRVLATTALYVIAAWAAIQVADLSIEAGLLHWPLRSVFVAAFLGFPVALIIAWFYDITRKGIVRTPPAGAPDSFDRSLGKKDYALLVSLAAIWVVANIIVYVPAPADRSIAILPFENRGHDPQGADLAFGVRLDLQTQLEALHDVRIIASTSTENVDTDLPVAVLAQQLGVAYVMRGTVERVLDRVRVSVTLVNANRDEQVWTSSWDRELDLTSLFDIRDDIATAVTNKLQATLSPQEAERIAGRPTDNFAAYQAYLLGKQRMARRTTGSLAEAIEFFEQAVEHDPQYALAWVGLAESSYLYMLYGGQDEEEWRPGIESAAQKARDLDRFSGEAYAILAMIEGLFNGDDIAAERAFLRALDLSPNYATAHHWYGEFLGGRARYDEALVRKRQALELDPASANTIVSVGNTLQSLGRFDEAMDFFLRAIDFDPDLPASYERIADLYRYAYGRMDEAVAWQLEGIARDPHEAMGSVYAGFIYLDLGDPAEAEKWFGRTPMAGMFMEPLLLQRGDYAGSAEIARRSIAWEPRMPNTLANLRNYDLRSGNAADPLARYELGYPELFADDAPIINDSNYGVAIDLALVLARTGEQDSADLLLERSLEHIRTIRRFGIDGYGISDVLVYSLQGDPKAALAALREAVDAGWRVYWWYYLEHDPNLESIRDRPEFQAILEEIRADMATQLARVRDLQASGDLPEIPDP